MKKFFGTMLIAGFVLCAVQLTLYASEDKMTDLPPPDGMAFWAYITAVNPYQNWSHWPGFEDIYPGKSPHGAFLKLYGNDIAIEAAKENKPMPYGAIIVKENYDQDKTTLMAITPMYKVEGFYSEGGDWFWAKYGADGKIMDEGQVKGCINCHGVQKGKDWRFVGVE